MTVFSFLYMTTSRMRDSGARNADTKAMLFADAGLNKAIWYLGTPPLSGGKGMTYRVNGTMEPYSDGRFYYSIQDTGTTNVMLVISTGESGNARKTVVQRVSLGGLPDAFKYSIYSKGQMQFNGTNIVYGEMYVAANTNIAGTNTIYGNIYHPNGTSISAGGGNTYTDGGPLTPPPGAPSFDKTYYTNLINTAKTYPAGSLYYNAPQTINLNGGTLYVNGNIHMNYPLVFNGPGRVVASGAIMYNSKLTATGPVEFICQTDFNMNQETVASESIFYTAGNMINNATARVDASCLLSMGNLTINGTAAINGLIYSEGNIIIQGNADINGSVVASKGTVTLNGTTKVTYNLGELPSTGPNGFTPTSISRVKGTWKG
jgi:hypothetical protein